MSAGAQLQAWNLDNPDSRKIFAVPVVDGMICRVKLLAWRPGARIEFSVVFDGLPQVFHFKSHEPSSEHEHIFETPDDGDICTYLQWSKEGQIAAGYSNGTICIWDEDSVMPDVVFNPESVAMANQSIRFVMWNEVNPYTALISANASGTVCVWDIAKNLCVN